LPAPQLNSLRSFSSEKIIVTSHGGKRLVMVPGGPVFALTSFAPAGNSWRKTTSLRSDELLPFFKEYKTLMSILVIYLNPELLTSEKPLC
jgi:hypothetical protein